MQDLSNTLIKKYTVEDISEQQVHDWKCYWWELNNNKELVEELKMKKVIFPEESVTGILIKKLLGSWENYKQ